MIYTLNVTCSYSGTNTREDLTFTSATQVAEYIRNYIDQPHIQTVLSDIEYLEIGRPLDDFLPSPLDIDAKCDASGDSSIVFEAGESVENAKHFAVVFRVTRKRGLT